MAFMRLIGTKSMSTTMVVEPLFSSANEALQAGRKPEFEQPLSMRNSRRH